MPKNWVTITPISIQDFAAVCLRLGLALDYSKELVKKAYPEIVKDANLNLEEYLTKLFTKKESLNEKENKLVDKKETKNTIHSVIMGGLRGQQDNATIIQSLLNAFPTVEQQKLKQRVYEYRNHFNKGKIK